MHMNSNNIMIILIVTHITQHRFFFLEAKVNNFLVRSSIYSFFMSAKYCGTVEMHKVNVELQETAFIDLFALVSFADFFIAFKQTNWRRSLDTCRQYYDVKNVMAHKQGNLLPHAFLMLKATSFISVSPNRCVLPLPPPIQ